MRRRALITIACMLPAVLASQSPATHALPDGIMLTSRDE